jgi:folate-binding protein YgfZ
MIRLDNQCLYHLKGLAVNNFLQGQVCSDIHLLKEGSSSLTGICNAKGRLVASPYLLLRDGEYYLGIEQKMAEILFQYWKPYLMISRVQALNLENYKAYGLREASASMPLSDFTIECAGSTRAKIIFTQDNLDSLCTTTSRDWFKEMIQSKVIIISPETSKEWMPLTLGYDNLNALSFHKGCYVGQEILARVHYKGSVNQSVIQVHFDEPRMIVGHEAIRDDQNNLVGNIAMSPDHPMLVTSTLAVLQKNAMNNILKLDDGTHCKLI